MSLDLMTAFQYFIRVLVLQLSNFQIWSIFLHVIMACLILSFNSGSEADFSSMMTPKYFMRCFLCSGLPLANLGTLGKLTPKNWVLL